MSDALYDDEPLPSPREINVLDPENTKENVEHIEWMKKHHVGGDANDDDQFSTNCCDDFDNYEAKLAKVICSCDTCREHRYCGGVRRTIYMLVALILLTFIFGAIVQAMEQDIERSDNQAYVSLMKKVRSNLTESTYQELVGLMGRLRPCH